MRIRVFWEGRTKDPHLRALQDDYAGRIAHFVDLAIVQSPSERRARASSAKGLTAADRHLLEEVQGSTKVVLDERGREWGSQEFAEWLGRQALHGTRELAFLVGGADGFSAAFREKADLLLALSRMTLTRDWARTLLLEQIYRGFTALRGYPYPRTEGS